MDVNDRQSAADVRLPLLVTDENHPPVRGWGSDSPQIPDGVPR